MRVSALRPSPSHSHASLAREKLNGLKLNLSGSDFYFRDLKPDPKWWHKVLGFSVETCAEKVTPSCVNPTNKICGDLILTCTCSGNTAKHGEEAGSLRGHLSFQTLCSSPLLFVWLSTFMTEGNFCLVLHAQTGCQRCLLPCHAGAPPQMAGCEQAN